MQNSWGSHSCFLLNISASSPFQAYSITVLLWHSCVVVGHMANSGQRTVKENDVCHFWAKACSNWLENLQCFFYHPSEQQLTMFKILSTLLVMETPKPQLTAEQPLT